MLQSAPISSAQTAYGFASRARHAAVGAKETGMASGSNGSARPATADDSAQKTTAGIASLTPEELQRVQQLKQTDRRVRAHEQAHLAAGADLVRGGASFSYQTGPDDRRYAVGGEVSIDASPGRTPQETIPKAQRIRAAALAPADPSPQDHSVAAQAGRMESEARVELGVQQREATSSAAQRNSGFYQQVAQSERGNRTLGQGVDGFA
jgi:hypothetical protein